ncbi:MAG: 4-hydroxy-3-methylbut-2-enyl diphosphate reductase [Rikenellaceae bacterium]
MLIEIDHKSGFCHGVVKAIEKAEYELNKGDKIYSLGDIMHNKVEMTRLESLGLKTINHSDLKELKKATVLIRAHGEPPSTYRLITNSDINLIDATCPVVSRLQKIVVQAYALMQAIDGKVVILGKPGHPEVIGLIGQIDGDALVVESVEELIVKADFSKPIFFLSQTTKSLDTFNAAANEIKTHYTNRPKEWCTIKDTICRQVSNRYPHLEQFASTHQLIIFVSGADSSNGKALFEVCKKANPNSHKIEDSTMINYDWFTNCSSVGICGATSTPMWQMEEVAKAIATVR